MEVQWTTGTIGTTKRKNRRPISKVHWSIFIHFHVAKHVAISLTMASLCGWGNLNNNLYFLLLGLGVDDAFVLTSEYLTHSRVTKAQVGMGWKACPISRAGNYPQGHEILTLRKTMLKNATEAKIWWWNIQWLLHPTGWISGCAGFDRQDRSHRWHLRFDHLCHGCLGLPGGGLHGAAGAGLVLHLCRWEAQTTRIAEMVRQPEIYEDYTKYTPWKAT